MTLVVPWGMVFLSGVYATWMSHLSLHGCFSLKQETGVPGKEDHTPGYGWYVLIDPITYNVFSANGFDLTN